MTKPEKAKCPLCGGERCRMPTDDREGYCRTKRRPVRLGDSIIGVCADCGRPFRAAEEYLLRNAVWLKAARKDERLHRACFAGRLGRPLTDADYLFRNRAEGNAVLVAYLDFPTYLAEWGHQFPGTTDLVGALAHEVDRYPAGRVEISALDPEKAKKGGGK
jgi:hypothetical protein